MVQIENITLGMDVVEGKDFRGEVGGQDDGE